MPANTTDIEKSLWDAADHLRANSSLKSSEYAAPVLGLIFLRYASERFERAEKYLLSQMQGQLSLLGLQKEDYQAKGILYLRPEARYSYVIAQPEEVDVPRFVNEAMKAIEEDNESITNSLPKNYGQLGKSNVIELLKIFNRISFFNGKDEHTFSAGDVFGKTYEYFLSKFAMAEGQRGGEFFTPPSLVNVIVEIIEPTKGRIFDPACGSGGMFVQSAKFSDRRFHDEGNSLSIYGQERVKDTIRLCKMNLAVHGLEGKIGDANSYYQTPRDYIGKFDFVMANPPFNVDGVDRDAIANRTDFFPFGIPKVNNANYLWIQLFYCTLNAQGRAGFVMANSASDARNSEMEIRQKLIQSQAIDVMIAIGSNFFYTVTLPCTLWFLDRGKQHTNRANTVLFIDARHIFTQVDRAHREFTPTQYEFVANIVRLYRGESPITELGSAEQITSTFPDTTYVDVPGLCKIATLDEIEKQGWSLNSGRYVGVAAREAETFDFRERLEELHEEFTRLTEEAHELEEQIAANMAGLLEK